jgi:hypothetical protein
MICQHYKNLLLIFIIFFLLLSASGIIAQSSLSYRWYFNANGGLSQTYGDIQESNNPIGKLSDETTFGYGARIGKYIGPVFSGHLQFYYSDMKGSYEEADRKFTANLMEYQLGTTVNLSNLFFGKKERGVNVYGTFGGALMLFRSEDRNISDNELINDYGYTDDAERKKDKRETAFAFPIGLGLDFKLTERWYVNLESVLRFTVTDKLDARIAGDRNDAYYYTSLGISYDFIGKKPKEIIETPPEIAIDPYANEYVDLLYDIPSNLKSNEAFVLKSIIHKGKINGPGRLVQILPIGLVVLDTMIAGAKASVVNYTLYLNWEELPADSVFEVSYRVKPNKIYGSFPMVSNLYLQRTGKEYKFRTSLQIEYAEEIVAKEKITQLVNKDTTPPVQEIEYRVQITAGYKSKIPIETLASKYKLDVEFKEDCLGNWCHYSVGSFDSYEKAKEYRNMLMKDHGARDAFIVAFYKGKRLNELSELKEVAAVTQPIKTVYKEGGYCYRVQILAMMNKSVDPESLRSIHSIDEEVNEEIYHNWHKYTVGKCTSIGEAKILLSKMKEKGITDAFITIYKNGERVLSDKP